MGLTGALADWKFSITAIGALFAVTLGPLNRLRWYVRRLLVGLQRKLRKARTMVKAVGEVLQVDALAM